MSLNRFTIAAALILAAPVQAAVVASEGGAEAQAWAVPVTAVFASVGTERIATLGSPSLTALSTLDGAAQYPFAAAPQALNLLAKNLQAYVAPTAFAAMPTEDKLTVLSAAAKGAETEAAEVADKALAAAGSRPFHPSTMDRASEQIARAEEVSFYLDASRREKTARMRSDLESFRSKWRDQVNAFEADLPGKIAAGAFDASNILVKTPRGWVAADESPDPIGTDLSKFYERRIQALSRAPKGPWSIQEATLLMGALARPDVGRGKPWSPPAREKLQNIVYSAQMTAGADLRLGKALEAFGLESRYYRLIPVRQILFIEQRYADLVVSAARQPLPIRLRMLATILNGSEGIPSWGRFQQLQRTTLSWTRRDAMVAAGFVIAGMAALGLLSTVIAGWPLAAKLSALTIAWLTPMILYVRGIILSARLESDENRSSVQGALYRTFHKN